MPFPLTMDRPTSPPDSPPGATSVRGAESPRGRLRPAARPGPAARPVLSLLLGFAFAAGHSGIAVACPFCNAVSQTLRQEMETMDAVVIAQALQSDLDRDQETGEVRMRIERVLRGDDVVSAGQEVTAIYYGEVTAGRRFMLSGVDPPMLQWSCLPLNERSERYVVTVADLPDDEPVTRLRYFMNYLQDEDPMLSRDAYDEFATTPYDAVQELGPHMDRETLIAWIRDQETSTDRRRLYFTMLGVCGDEKDVPFLASLLKSTQPADRSGLDALIACYLTLAGESGLPLVNELFLENQKASYADTYAAIMAIRFHGTEGGVIARSALVESLHHVLERKDLADLVIPDLARWNDWSQVDRLTELFIEADPDNNWIRVPVVNYLRACPLPEAEEALEKCKEVDPESVRRANTFFSIPKPGPDAGPNSSSWDPSTDDQTRWALAAPASDDPAEGPIAARMPGVFHRASSLPPGEGLASAGAVPGRPPSAPRAGQTNPWRLIHVVAMASATVMIAQYLLLSGGRQAA